MPKPAYGYAYQQQRKAMLADGPLCVHCLRRPATEADHQPPLALHDHVLGTGCCVLVPSCWHCARIQAGVLGQAGRARPAAAEIVEPDGLAADDTVWDVPWLDDLREVPGNATWPRLMTAPHPRAVGSLGAEVALWSFERRRRPWRWWQRLAATRLLEVDVLGELVWRVLLLTLARQVGKTWWLRDVCDWRLEQGERFGVEQLVLSTGKDLAVVREMQRPARVRAKAFAERYKVREVNGQEEIEMVDDGSRWMVRSREGVYGLTASMASVDEAWKVSAAAVDDGLEPTMVEQPQSQLLLVSTAHRRATALMIGRRAGALGRLDDPGDEVALLIEWSAPRAAELDDRRAWKLASPHWTTRRESLIAERLRAAQSGESDDPDEPDPIESFRTQWLNQWPPKRIAAAKGDPLVDDAVWAAAWCNDDSVGSLVIGVEDNYGQGAAVGFCGRLPDERFVIGGQLCSSRPDAYALAAIAATERPGSVLVVGASLSGDPALEGIDVSTVAKAGTAETPPALSMLRDMVTVGAVVQDGSAELDEQMAAVRVKDGAGGLHLVVGPRSDLLRAAVWALRVAVTSPAPAPAIH